MKKLLKTVAMMMALVMVIDTPVSAANIAGAGEDRASSTITATTAKPDDVTEGDPGTGDGTDDGDDWGSVDGTDKVPGQVLAVVAQGGTTRNVEKGAKEEVAFDVITNGGANGVENVKFSIKWDVVEGDAVKLVSTNKNTCNFEAVHGGTAKIKATAFNGVSSASASVTVNVKEYAQEISFKEAPYTMYSKQKVDMSVPEKLDKYPESANDKIYYQVSNTKIASVDANGILTLKKDSLEPITLTASTERGVRATATITVAKGTPAKKVTLDSGKSKTLTYGEDLTIKIDESDLGAGCTDTFDWTSAKTNFVEIVEVAKDRRSAKVKAVGVGKSVITVKASSGKKATVTITVDPNMEGMTVVDANGESTGMVYPKMKFTLTAKPADAFNSSKNTGSFKWTSDNSKVAAVSGKGVVTVKGSPSGTTKITATEKKTGKSATYTLTIEESKITGITSVNGAATLDVGTQAQYGANVTGEGKDLFNQISWAVSGSSLKIDDNGRATAVKAGKATIKATVVNSQGKAFSATKKVEVIQPVLEASFKTPTIAVAPVKKNKNVSFKLVVGPKGAKVKNDVTYKCEVTKGASGIASVDQKGKVTVTPAAQAGDIITVTATMPSGISTTGTIKVVEKGKFDLNVFKSKLAEDSLDGKLDAKKILILKQGESLDLEHYLTVSGVTSTDNTIQTPYTYTLPKNNTAVAVANGKIYGLLTTGSKTVSVKVKAVGGATTTIKVKVTGETVIGTNDGDDKGSGAGDDKGSNAGDDKGGTHGDGDKKAKDGNDKM